MIRYGASSPRTGRQLPLAGTTTPTSRRDTRPESIDVEGNEPTSMRAMVARAPHARRGASPSAT
jgi:hypothetical protein